MDQRIGAGEHATHRFGRIIDIVEINDDARARGTIDSDRAGKCRHETAPDAPSRSRDDQVHYRSLAGETYHAASTRRKPFRIAVGAPERSTSMKRSCWKLPLTEMRGSAVRCSACSGKITPGRVVTAVR